MSNTVYHGSASLFESFSLTSAGLCRNASNGALGIWVTPDRNIATSFGGNYSGYLYTLFTAQTRVKKFPLQWLMDRHDDVREIEATEGLNAAVQFYDRIRLSLIAEGYTELWITEDHDTAPTRVVLDPGDIGILSIEKIEILSAA